MVGEVVKRRFWGWGKIFLGTRKKTCGGEVAVSVVFVEVGWEIGSGLVAGKHWRACSCVGLL